MARSKGGSKQRFRLTDRRVFVAGHRGMVGAALIRQLSGLDCEILSIDRAALDLRRQAEVAAWFQTEQPDVVLLAAATVGGIQANAERPAEFIYDNLAIETNIIDAAHRTGVAKLAFLGSSCIYPKLAPQPMAETSLLTGPLEPTNEAYAIAKIAGLKMAQAYRAQYGTDFITVIPTNLYGPGDNFDPAEGHVISALLVKAHAAKQAGAAAIEVWGSGRPKREFLHVDDAAAAILHLLMYYSEPEPINVGAGTEVSIAELAHLVSEVVGFSGELVFKPEMPDGMPRKLLDDARFAKLGWKPTISLRDGLKSTYRWYLENVVNATGRAA